MRFLSILSFAPKTEKAGKGLFESKNPYLGNLLNTLP